MKISISILLMFFFSSIAFSQETRVTKNNVVFYTVDQSTGEIYYTNYSGNLYKIDSLGMETIITDFPAPPVFANKSHKAVYQDHIKNKIYLYDFDTKITENLPDRMFLLLWPSAFFSPNDKKIVMHDWLYDFTTKKYFYDNRLSVRTDDVKVIWTSDSSLIDERDNRLIEYYPDSKREDTLFEISPPNSLSDFAYSLSQRRVYHSTTVLGDTRLNVFYMDTRTDSLVYSFVMSETDSHMMMAFQSMSWSPDKKLLGFIGSYAFLNRAELYVFSTDSNKVFRLTSIQSNAGSKMDLKWLNNRSFLYLKQGILYRYDLPQRITETKLEKEIPADFRLSGYPNPFNSSTVINFSIPEKGNARLNIFNSMGQMVKNIDLGEIEKGNNIKVNWNGKDNSGNQLSSGIYYISLGIITKGTTLSKTIKLALIK